jgi:Cof subfamily protein (haloacid dehalogenase superfamily)
VKTNHDPFAMKYRLVAIDIDGTLLNSEGEIPPDNFAAIQETVSRGVQVVLITGRRLATARKVHQQLNLHSPMVVHNGAMIASGHGSIPLARFYLSFQAAREVLKISHAFVSLLVLHLEDEADGFMVVHPASMQNLVLQRYLSKNHQRIITTESLNEFATARLIQIMFAGDLAQLDEVEDELRQIPAEIKPHITKTCYPARNFGIMDVLDGSCSKGKALHSLALQMGIHPQQILAIGDNHNDLEMLDYAGTGVVVANSVSEIKNNRYFVTGSNDHAGVAQALRQLILEA